ncbi:MAG: hypothetical protein GYA55_01255 [SAR324 cluster bacterium]|uniref:Uncharacterized protein n=1 Tax=SAR324 cluster bacterium TaxID=2024889 RepID=A0A7X9FPG0_9DELT|nr:hypothetical protein [SAR324 cluster bacterium]
MIALNELSNLFCKDRAIGVMARKLLFLARKNLICTLEVDSYVLSKEEETNNKSALEALSAFGLVKKSSNSTTGFRYSIPAETLSLIEQAVLAMENHFLLKRSAEWHINAKSRLEWIEGLYHMIQKGREKYYANIR